MQRGSGESGANKPVNVYMLSSIVSFLLFRISAHWKYAISYKLYYSKESAVAQVMQKYYFEGFCGPTTQRVPQLNFSIIVFHITNFIGIRSTGVSTFSNVRSQFSHRDFLHFTSVIDLHCAE